MYTRETEFDITALVAIGLVCTLKFPLTSRAALGFSDVRLVSFDLASEFLQEQKNGRTEESITGQVRTWAEARGRRSNESGRNALIADNQQLPPVYISGTNRFLARLNSRSLYCLQQPLQPDNPNLTSQRLPTTSSLWRWDVRRRRGASPT